MKPTELVILLPCHSLEDFPTHHTGESATGLLAAWTALWHPALIAASGKMPTWSRVEDPPENLAGRYVVVPTVCDEHGLPDDLISRAETEGALLVVGLTDRAAILERLLGELAKSDAEPPTTETDATSALTPALSEGEREQSMFSPALSAEHSEQREALAADFLSLGLCYLMTELLTRRMRYMSHLDEVLFQDAVIAAATAWAAGHNDIARDSLQRCFDSLLESRGHFYPVDTHLLDFTLLADTTLGPSLRRELLNDQPMNLLVSGALIEQMAVSQPESLAMLREQLTAQRVALVGGERHEIELPLLPLESILAQLETGRTIYELHLATSPKVFGRRRFGLTPGLPQILRGLGFTGAFHVTLDDGRFPQSDRSKTMWEGTNYASIDTIGRVPLDANDPASILSLSEKLGESMDYDHVSMIAFAHWPGQTSIFYDDFRRIGKYANVLGKFTTVDEFFANTDAAGQFSKFEPDQYRAPYLQQAVHHGRVNLLSSIRRHHAMRRQISTVDALLTWASLLSGYRSNVASDVPSLSAQMASADLTNEAMFASLEKTILAGVESSATLFAQSLPHGTDSGGSGSNERGLLLYNPLSFSRTIGVDVSALASLPIVDGPVVAVEEVPQPETRGNSGALANECNVVTRLAMVQLPPLGFAWIGSGNHAGGSATATKRSRRREKSIVNDNVLENEYVKVTIDAATGGIRSINDFHTRGNRLSQQIGFRLPSSPLATGDIWRDPDESPEYSVMAVDNIAMTHGATLCGELTSRGRLMHVDGRVLATYVQRTRLWRGSRTVEVDIELSPVEMPAANPWASYYACRFAWPGDFSELRRSVHGASHATEAKRLEAPEFIELIGEKTQTVFAFDGLPYHLRAGHRMLDSLLIVRGDESRSFRFAIGIDTPRAWQVAAELSLRAGGRLGRSAPQGSCVAPGLNAAPRGPRSSWLFHLDAQNVAVTHWEPLLENIESDGSKVVGFRCRLQEMQGRGVTAKLRSFRKPASAQRVDFLGTMCEELPIDGDAISIDLGSYEFMQFDAYW